MFCKREKVLLLDIYQQNDKPTQECRKLLTDVALSHKGYIIKQFALI